MLFQPEQAANEYHGVVFNGEAPESDDEILAFSKVKLGTAQEVTEIYKPSPTRHVRKESLDSKSVLQKILGRNKIELQIIY